MNNWLLTLTTGNSVILKTVLQSKSDSLDNLSIDENRFINLFTELKFNSKYKEIKWHDNDWKEGSIMLDGVPVNWEITELEPTLNIDEIFPEFI